MKSKGQFPFDIGSNTIEALIDLSANNTASKTYKSPLLQVYHVNAVGVFDENQHLVGDLQYIGVACFVISLFFCIFYAVWTYRNRRERVVKASQVGISEGFFEILNGGSPLLTWLEFYPPFPAHVFVHHNVRCLDTLFVRFAVWFRTHVCTFRLYG